HRVAIWLSEKCGSPLTVGFLKPVILLPIAAVTRLNTDQLKAVISHELFHIRRNDYLWNIILTVTEVLLFFNPFAIMLVHTVRREMENSCDDQVLEAGFDRWEYSEALFLLGNEGGNKNILMLAATGNGEKLLLQRVRRMMNRNHSAPGVRKPLAMFCIS